MNDDSNMSWDFLPDDDIKITEGTEATVTALVRDGKLLVHKRTTTGKDLLSIQFQIADGQYKGRRASMTLWPDPNNFAFRNQVQALTGINIASGERAGMEDISSALDKFSYKVKLGIDRNGYTVVKYVDGRTDKIEVESAQTIGESSYDDDEDIPF